MNISQPRTLASCERAAFLDEAAQAVAEGRDPRGVVRTSEENDFRELVAISGTLSAVITKEDYVAALEKSEDLYELAPLPPLSDDAPPGKLSVA